MGLEENKQLCRDYFAAFLAGDREWMEQHIAATFERHDPGLPFEVKGPDGVMQRSASSRRPAGGLTCPCSTSSRSATGCSSSTGRNSTTWACSRSSARCRRPVHSAEREGT